MVEEDHEVELAELLKEVRRIAVMSRRLIADVLAGGYSTVFKGMGIELDEVREYVPGDDPRRIDPHVSARLGRPFVKRYVDERELTVMFLLDLSASMSGGFGVWSARQMAARVCACLALSAVQSGDKVGLIATSREVTKVVPPGPGLPHALRIIRDCLALSGGHLPGTALGPALETASRILHRRSILFLVSDFLADGWRDPLRLAARRHDVIAVRLLTPELVPPDSGLARVRDPETGRETVVDWSRPRVRRDYERAVAGWLEDGESELRRAGVDLMDVPVPRERDRDAVARPILRFFRMREQRSAHG